jgi:hypothetical protein
MPSKLILIICILISSFANAQVNVVGYIQTNGVADYPTHIDSMGKGGYMIAKNITERNAIPCLRKKYGMACYVQSEQKMYILKDSTCINTWVEFSGGGGGSSKGGANGIDTNNIGQIVWGGTPIYTNVQLDDDATRSHSLQYGQATEFYGIFMKAGEISMNPTQYPDVQINDTSNARWKILVADTANNWRISSINKNLLGGVTYYVTTGFFIVTDSSGSPSQEFVILENTFPNSHWGVNWNGASNTWFVFDDLSDSTSLVLNEYLSASFGVKSGRYHADALSVVMFPIDDKSLKHKYGIQVLDKNGNAQQPTNLDIDRKNKIYFEIRRYFNVPQ